jgi:DNA polymerase sigma
VEEFKQKMISLILNKQLNNLLDNLSLQSNSNYQSKVVAFERVRYFVKSLCPYSDAVLFGSNAVGLSLPSSDIDIMLVDIHCKTK